MILVRPQLGQNIGTAARAMWNFGLAEMRIVAPRDGWPSDEARKAASGADIVIDGVTVFDTAEEAVGDLAFVLATSARTRDMVKPIYTPEKAVQRLRGQVSGGARTGLLFGPERTGLTNDEVVLADALLRVPVNPSFASLNLAQAVLLMGYEWFRTTDQTEPARLPIEGTRPASRSELIGFFEHLESALDAANFLKPPEKRPAMVRNIRNIFHRTELTEQDVKTLRGIVSAFERLGKGPADG